MLRGRSHLLPEDVHAVARDVLRHRVLLTFDALARGITAEDVVERVVSTVTAPRMSSGPTAVPVGS